MHIPHLIGKKVNRDIKKGEQILYSDIQNL